ncbi:hypothetical protein, partial [Paenibacillus thiaminolyticus]|uniref:hypothetical protein n=1 Tax=Paenibacillus thiaminolyticus TaxID=49283 RepID=UPI001C724CE0
MRTKAQTAKEANAKPRCAHIEARKEAWPYKTKKLATEREKRHGPYKTKKLATEREKRHGPYKTKKLATE